MSRFLSLQVLNDYEILNCNKISYIFLLYKDINFMRAQTLDEHSIFKEYHEYMKIFGNGLGTFSMIPDVRAPTLDADNRFSGL